MLRTFGTLGVVALVIATFWMCWYLVFAVARIRAELASLRAELFPSVHTLSSATVVGIAAGDVRAGDPVTVLQDGRVQAVAQTGEESPR